MLIFLIILAVYLFESLRAEIVVMTINFKLSKRTDKQLSRWWCLLWPYMYIWLAYRKTQWWRSLAKFLTYKQPV